MKNNNLLQNLFQIIIVLFGISFLTFGLIYLSPGDPVEIMLTESGEIPTPELVTQIKEEMGLNKPFIEQYITWISSVIKGDFGKSYSLQIPVIDKIKKSFVPTSIITLLALTFTIIISFPLGILAAIKENKWQDYLIRYFTFIGISIPNFWLGLIFLSIFGVMLKWVTVSGGDSNFKSLILPAFTISLAMSAKYTRQIRQIFLEELNKSYVIGAKMRGIKEKTILFKHIIPNAMLPLITLFGLSLGSLLGGTAVVEIVYNVPGMGNMAIKAISYRDYPLIQAYVLLIALIYMILNMIIDFSYKYLDSRIQGER